MAESRPIHSRGAPHCLPPHSSGPVRSLSPKSALCVLPRHRRTNPFAVLMPRYQFAMADSFLKLSRLAKQNSFDLYLIHSPLGWIDLAEACRKVRDFDTHTPLVVYSLLPSPSERREVMAAGARAYVARSDDAHNLPGIAGQLIMLAELRSMDAMSSGGHAIQEKLVHRLAQLNKKTRGGESLSRQRSTERLKLEARKLFAQAGGSRANFERLWPSIYERALRQIS